MSFENIPTVDLIDLMYETRERKYQVAFQLKAIETEFDAFEAEVMSRCLNENIKTMGTPIAKISLSEQVVPNVEDWDLLLAHIKENDAFYLLKRQLNSGPYREIVNAGDSLPGVVPFTKTKMSLTKA